MNCANLNGYGLVGEEVGQFKVGLASRQVGEHAVTAALNNLNKFIELNPNSIGVKYSLTELGGGGQSGQVCVLTSL